MRRLPILALLIILTVPLAHAVCAPEKLVRIVYRDRTPGLREYQFESQPVTVVRMGSEYGRIEEVAAPELGRHSVWISNEPDHWEVNLLTGIGSYKMNRTTDPWFRAPVFDEDEVPASMAELEFGCEREFMLQHATEPPKRAKLKEFDILNYEFRDGAYLLRFAIIERIEMPFGLGLYKDGELLRFLRYDLYQDGLPADTRPFWPPPNIQYVPQD
jgi:hypothetical protein